MSDPGENYEENENTRMNWFVAIVLIAGVPLYAEVWNGHPWAEIALKVYLCSATVFGSLLFFLERKSLRKRWLWIGMAPLLILHGAVMYGLVLFNEAFPRIDRVPVAAYGALVPAMALETGILYVILERFRPKAEKRGTR